MAPQYKLIYFDIRGISEPIRYILSYAKVNWVDERVEYVVGVPTDEQVQWNKLKPDTPWGVLPILEKDGKQLSQSLAIVRYLGKKHGLGGSNDWENAKCDEYLDAINDLKNEIVKALREKDETKKAEIEKNNAEVMVPTGWKRFNEILKKNGSGYLVGKKLTYADIMLTHHFEWLSLLTGTTDKMGEYPELQALLKKVTEQPEIKKWIQKRPVTPF